MKLDLCVKAILDKFAHGDYFDSHTVINALLADKEYYPVYLAEYSSNYTVAQYHGKIAQMIGEQAGISKAGTAKSHTIYGDLSDNQLWKKA